MIRHKPHCAVTQSTGMHDDADCTCGSTRRGQRKNAPVSMLHAIKALEEELREELRILRSISTEAAVSLSIDRQSVLDSTNRIRALTHMLERDLFDRPELPLTGRSE